MQMYALPEDEHPSFQVQFSSIQSPVCVQYDNS